MSTLPLMYLDSPTPDLWKYQDRGDVIVWSDTGETIMLSIQAATLCTALSRELSGLPSLTAILCISDALSKGWNATQSTYRINVLRKSIQDRKHNTDRDSHSHIVDWLESLGHLSLDLRKGIHAQSAFLIELWENFPRSWLEIDQQESRIAIDWLSIPFIERPNIDFSSLDVSSYRSKKALQALEFASLLTVDEKAIRHRLNTGVDATSDLPTTTEAIELKEPINQLLNQLYQEAPNTDQGLVASLAWALSSFIALPRQPSEPDNLQIGGVSDISNRGNPQRLLMTELAADPDLLIARIANGQALYLRRESPPKPRPETRDILIENSIRCWGEQRLTIFALALAAAAAEEKRGTKINVTTLAGNDLFSEDFSNLEGLTSALERLHFSTHPGQAIEHLIQKRNREKQPLNEPLVIVTAATARDPDFIAKSQKLPSPYLLAAIETDRWVEIREQTNRGSSLWKRLQLTSAKRSKPKAQSTQLPQFIRHTCSPLRFICDLQVPFVQLFENGRQPGAWLITKQCRLLHFTQSGLGGIDLGSVPTDNVLAAVTSSKDGITMVIERNGRSSSESVHYLVSASLIDGIRCQLIEIPSESNLPLKYCFDQGLLWRIGKHLDLIDLTNGKVIAQSPTRQRHLGGPFFGDKDVMLASYVNHSIVWHHLGKCSSAVGFVVRTGTEPLAVAADFSWTKRFTGTNEPELSTGRKIISNAIPELVRVRYDQTEVLATISKVTKAIGFNTTESDTPTLSISLSLKTRILSRPRLLPHEAIRSFERADLQLPIRHSVSSKFNFIGLHPEGLLLARNRNKQCIVRVDKGRFHLENIELPGASDSLRPFGDDVPQECEWIRRRWRLNRADLGQCTTWLDSRGLLHLRDSDGIELSLMLAQSSLAGWFSQGETFGASYFTGKSATPASPAVCEWYMRFLEQCYL